MRPIGIVAIEPIGDHPEGVVAALENVALTAPYMHDDRYETLEEVVDFYSEGLRPAPTIDPLMQNVARGGLGLTAEQKSDLLAFLHTLTDRAFTENPAFASPFE